MQNIINGAEGNRERARRLGTVNACLRGCKSSTFLKAGGWNRAFVKRGEWALWPSSEDWPNEPSQEGQTVLLSEDRRRRWPSTGCAMGRASRTEKRWGVRGCKGLVWQGERGGREDRSYEALELFHTKITVTVFSCIGERLLSNLALLFLGSYWLIHKHAKTRSHPYKHAVAQDAENCSAFFWGVQGLTKQALTPTVLTERGCMAVNQWHLFSSMFIFTYFFETIRKFTIRKYMLLASICY